LACLSLLAKFYQVEPTDEQVSMYVECLLDISVPALKETNRRCMKNWVPEKMRLPVPSELLAFCSSETEQEAAAQRDYERQMREAFERENADGSVDEAREKCRAEFQKLVRNLTM
jgi:hypothetical protein